MVELILTNSRVSLYHLTLMKKVLLAMQHAVPRQTKLSEQNDFFAGVCLFSQDFLLAQLYQVGRY